MSVATGNKGEKAKKFQSLNINNLYQGSALKPLQKSIPTKHGLQSLGKVPTARRAPANLPSLKAEHSGNDPSINLIPGGQGAAGGWNSNKEDGEGPPPGHGKPKTSVINQEVAAPATLVQKNSVNPNVAANVSPSVANRQPSSLSGSKASWGQTPTQPGPGSGKVLSQRSPLFGQDFPSLGGESNATEDGSPSPSPPKNSQEAKFGPGPSLRPQNFPSWSFNSGGNGKQNSGIVSLDKDGDIKPASAYESRHRNSANSGNSAASSVSGSTGTGPENLKFDVGVNSPLLQQGGAPYIGRSKSSGGNQRSQLVNKNSSSSAARPRETLFQGSIIDSEKLKRMDDIDSNDDDWTRTDDSFDYNKRIESDEEEDYSLSERGHSNWTDQISFSSNSRHSEPRDNFESKSYSRQGRQNANKVPAPHQDHNHLSFLDDDDHRLSKKNEEVLKNIERARRRRAEEEQKYRINDDFTDPRASRTSNDTGYRENGIVSKSPSAGNFGKFDVGESDGYDSAEKFESYNDRKPAPQPQAQPQSSNSVPPRFKRHGVELHSYKRTSPPKERFEDNDLHHRSSTSRESAEVPSQEKQDYGALFRNNPAPPPASSSWGPVHRRQSASSDQNTEDLSRCEESSASTATNANGADDNDKKFIAKDQDHEEQPMLSRSSGRHSLNKGNKKQEEGRHKKDRASSDMAKGQQQKSKEERGSNSRGQRGQRGQNEARNKRSDNDQKGQRRSASQKKDEDHEAVNHEQASELQAPTDPETGGWFAPRGQPSRRGRGGLASGGGGRRPPHNDHKNDGDDPKPRKSHRDLDWDESSSDRSAGLTEESKKDGNRPRRGDGKSREQGNNRREKSNKKQQQQSQQREQQPKQPHNRNNANNDGQDDKKTVQVDTENDKEAGSGNNGRNRRGGDRGGNNQSRSYRGEEKDGGRNANSDRDRRERDKKQTSYERRQSKLPPRLAKQKEQNRFSGGSQSISQSQDNAWGTAPNESKLEQAAVGSSSVAWDLLPPQSQQQFNNSVMSTGINYDTNRALLLQRFRNEESLASEAANMRLENTAAGLAVGGGSGGVQSMDEAFTSESRENNAVQTIIFENTNFKGNRPAPNATAEEKLMFKLGNDKMGFGGKVEDDLKLDFNFDAADINTHVDEKGEKTVVRSVPASTSAVPTTSQPASADDLNMKIASVKKVWETLPSMSPVPVSSNDQNLAFNAEDKGFDPATSGRPEVKVRPQQQSQPPQSSGSQVQAQQVQQAQAQQQQAHHLPPPSQPSPHGGQVQVQSQQLHHAAATAHQGLLQQAASLDDRLMGRGNNANLAYNRLLGTGGLPNLQSPPSILGQQPSLYQAFQIDPNRGVTNQLYPYPPTGMGGQSLILPPSGSAAGNSGTSTTDIFGSSSTSQFGRQFAGPPPGSTQASSVMSSVLMSQPSLMSSAMKPSVASGAIGPIGTKGAFQQGGLGSLSSGTSPLLIPYDGGYVQNIQRSAAAAAGQTAFYQALAASSQQAAAANSRHQQNSYGMTAGFPGQQSLVQQQLMRNQVPPQMQHVKDKTGQQLGGLQNRQFSGQPQPQQQAPPPTQVQQAAAVKSTATSLASMTLRNSLGTPTSANTNGTAPAATSTAGVPQTTSYSPTPIQRPPAVKGKGLGNEDNSAVLEVNASKDKKLSGEVDD